MFLSVLNEEETWNSLSNQDLFYYNWTTGHTNSNRNQYKFTFFTLKLFARSLITFYYLVAQVDQVIGMVILFFT